MSGKFLLFACLSALMQIIIADSGKLEPDYTSTEGPYPSSTEYPWIDTGNGITPKFDLLPSYEECGRAGSPDRIVGGEKCALEDFPWTALLQYRYNSRGYSDFLCGGVLISDRYVLTASHCVRGQIGRIGPLVSVRLGEYDMSKIVDCVINQGCNKGATIDIPVEEIIPHPRFDPFNISRPYDIALIRLAEKVEFNHFVKPVCLPNRGNYFKMGQKLWVSGWGQTENGKYSDIKLKVQVPTLPIQGCQIPYEKLDGSVRLDDHSQFCAGGDPGKDSCRGDSGGAAMRVHIDEETGKKVHICDGVISFGPSPCGKKGIPGVYTKVVHHLDWILNNMRP